MSPEYARKAPAIRFVFIVAAMTITLSLGSFIDLLATPHFSSAEQVRSSAEHVRPVVTASRS